MVRYIYLPQQVKDAIKKHLDHAIEKAIKGFPSAYEDEDVLTGHLFGLMKIDEQVVEIDDVEIGGKWKWSIDYKKFRGRGKNATESILGADGIIELNLFRDGRSESKTLLFQSKLDWKRKDKDLYVQCSKLLTWLGAVTVINYTEDEFETYKVEDIFANHGEKPVNTQPLKELLGGDFLNCTIGDGDLKYDPFTKTLSWLDVNNDVVSTKFNMNRKLKIKVKAPVRFPYQKQKVAKEIPNGNIMEHKLKNENADLKIDNAWNNKELNAIKKKASMTFHPDRHNLLPEKEKNMLDDMMKDINEEISKQKERIKRRNQ